MAFQVAVGEERAAAWRQKSGPGNFGAGFAGPDQQARMLTGLLENPRVAEEIGLTDDQKAKLKDTAFAHRQEAIKLRAELELAGAQQARLLTEEPLNEQALMDVVEKSGRIRTELAKLHVRGLLDARAVLTAEQRGQLRDVARKMHQRRVREGQAGNVRAHPPVRQKEAEGKLRVQGDRREEPLMPADAPRKPPAAE
jgi:Spy/CpxP family protein refolding chaperone